MRFIEVQAVGCEDDEMIPLQETVSCDDSSNRQYCVIDHPWNMCMELSPVEPRLSNHRIELFCYTRKHAMARVPYHFQPRPSHLSIFLQFRKRKIILTTPSRKFPSTIHSSPIISKHISIYNLLSENGTY